ncbi:uncharacterized protein ACRADG_001793 isoform 2-T2 [Cochliomyia hominivorax]
MRIIILLIIVFIKLISSYIPLHHEVYGKHNTIENEYVNFECPPKTFYTPHSYPGNCTLFIECNGGEATIKHCASGLLFDKKLKLCYEKNKVKCDYNTNHTTNIITGNFRLYCPFGVLGVFPHPFSNQKYLKCVYGRLYEKSCRSEFIYNLFEKSCEKYQGDLNESLPFVQEKYSAESKVENDGTYTYLKCPADFDGNFIHPFNCSNYINCSPVRGTRKGICPRGQRFNFKQQTCQPENKMNKHVECLVGQGNENLEELYSSPLGVFCKSDEISQKYPHPDNWHKYVYCDNYKLKVQWCPLHQVFNPEDQKCVDEQKMLEND